MKILMAGAMKFSMKNDDIYYNKVKGIRSKTQWG
jgi:hypothetical protein